MAITPAQVQALDGLREDSDAPILPPRVAQIPNDVLANVGDMIPGVGDGTVLQVGRLDEDMDDCPCGIPHVQYVSIKEDGELSPFLTSGTFGEMLAGLPDWLLWDNTREVRMDEWPVDSASLTSVDEFLDDLGLA